MKRNSFYSLILGAVLICSCTEESSVVYPLGNEDASMGLKSHPYSRMVLT